MLKKQSYCMEITSLKGKLRYLQELYKMTENNNIEINFVFRKGDVNGYIKITDGEAKELIELLLGVKTSKKLNKCRSSLIIPAPFTDIVGYYPNEEAIYWMQNTSKFKEYEGIVLGKTLDNRKITLSIESLWRHIGIYGTTGSGKTTTASHIITEVNKLHPEVNIIVFDWHNEYHRVLEELEVEFKRYYGESLPPAPLYVNDESLEVLKAIFRLSEFQAYALKLILDLAINGTLSTHSAKSLGIDKSYEYVLKDNLEQINSSHLLELAMDLWDKISSKPDSTSLPRLLSKSEAEIWAALMRRLELLSSPSYSKFFSLRISSLKSLMNTGVHVLQVGSIEDTNIRKLYVLLMLTAIYALRKRNIVSKTVIVVEEAHNIIEVEAGKKILKDIMREARKYQLGLIIISHSIATNGGELLQDINTLILHKLHNSVDIKLIEQFFLDKKLRTYLPLLEKGEAIIISPDLLYPQITIIGGK